MRPLVTYDAKYYTYPTSVSRGYWLRIPIEDGLDASLKERRLEWLRHVGKLSSSEFHTLVFGHFAEAADFELLQSLLVAHGPFAERFFHARVRERVTRALGTCSITLDRLSELLRAASEHALRPRHPSEAVFAVTDHIFEQLVVRAQDDRSSTIAMRAWYKRHSHPRQCSLCGSCFRAIDLPDWIYFGSAGYGDCCFLCPIMASPKKRSLSGLIADFVRQCGFVPNSEAGPIAYSFTSRISADRWASVIRAYAAMGGIRHVGKKFGSWFQGLANSGVLPRGTLSTSRGLRCLARDGHVCHSLDEQRIDDWLSDHGLPHEREPLYPRHPALNPSGQRRADWLVKGVFVEYFGLVGEPQYEKRMAEKLLLAQRLKLPILALYPSDVVALDTRLDGLRKVCGTRG